MKLLQLKTVVAIAEHGSLRAAARHLKAAQPALTRHLAELERELGTPIFERGSQGMVPTVAGAAFVNRAASILNETVKASEEARQLAGGAAGTVTVGLSIASHMLFLPQSLQPFRKRYPGVQLQIVEGNYPGFEHELRSGKIDFYVGPIPPTRIAPELMEEMVVPNMRTIICRTGHPLTHATSLAQLCDAEWLAVASTSDGEEQFRGMFEKHGLPQPRVAMRGQSALTLMTALAYSDLLALMPVQWLEFDLTRHLLQAIEVAEPLPAPSLVAIRRRALPLTPAAQFLIDLFARRADLLHRAM